ncbi:MAG: helix-hairpin-helix domain-containing protein [Nocardioidaceae bacterium]
MFRRRTSLDSDAVAAAQRRLAALSAHFAPADAHDGEVPDEAFGLDSFAEGVAAGDNGAGGESANHSSRMPMPRRETAVTETGSGRESTPRAGRHAARDRDGRRALESGRWEITPHQVTIAALITVALIALAGWWLLRSLPEPQPVRLSNTRTLPSTTPSVAPSPGAPSVSPAPVNGSLPTTPSTATAGAALVVDVTGKVRRPGIVELPAGARVIDALKAAGGVRRGVSTLSLNLARPLIDGEQVVVGIDVPQLPPAMSTPPAGSSTTDSIAPVNLNAATQEQLETLPDVGPVTAQSILTWRSEHTAFSSVDELLEVSGIGDATLAKLRPYVYV